MPEVCKELREDIIEEVAVNPGHLASSLGAMEITVACHYVFDTPEDRIVWDVGHQAYGHKILTGSARALLREQETQRTHAASRRRRKANTTRFTCGHASNSISAALGMAVAAKLTNHPNRHVVAIIGDGAMSGGLALKASTTHRASPTTC